MEKEKKAEIVEVQRESLPAVKSDPESLIAMAIKSGASVDSIERLMTMRRELRAESAKEEYDSAMAAFQGECPVIKKTKAGGSTKSGKVAYYYAPLDSIVEQTKALIQKHGFSYAIQTETKAAGVVVICQVKHMAGHSESSTIEIPLGTKTDIMSASQVVASALTFAKRYAFCNAFGILTGDDDDDSHSTKAPVEKPAQAPAKPAVQKPVTGNPATKPVAPAQQPDKPTRPAQMINMNKKYLVEVAKVIDVSENGMLKLTQKAETLTGSEYLLELKKFMAGYIKNRVENKVFSQEQVDFALEEYKVLSFIDLKFENAIEVLKELSAGFNPAPVNPPAGLK